MTRLRRQMPEELERHNYSPNTIRSYIRTVEGLVAVMTKAEGTKQLEELLAPVNRGSGSPSSAELLGRFVDFVFLPFYRRKWKRLDGDHLREPDSDARARRVRFSTARKFRSGGVAGLARIEG